MRPRRGLALAVLAWAACLAVAVATRPLLAVDETRYVTVAWEMWSRGDLLVPRLNGAPYSHKPPLLFWAIQLAWALAGVRETAARLVPPLFALATLWLTSRLALRLWPERPSAAGYAPLVLAGTMAFAVFGTAVMFDAALACATAAGLTGVVVARTAPARGWGLFGLSLGAALLTKGPVALVHLLPVPALAPAWAAAPRPRWPRWYAGLAAGLALGAGLALAWALPAAAAGGEAYGRAILWGQTAGRVVASFAHAEPAWYYAAILPAVLYPWVLWPPLWGAARRHLELPPDEGTRLCLVWAVATLAGLSAVSGKQAHYLLPMLPAAALLAGRLLAAAPSAPRAADVLLPALVPVALGVALGALPEAAAASASLRALPAWVLDFHPLTGAALVVGSIALAIGAGSPLPRAVAGVTAGAVLLFAVAHLEAARGAFARYDLAPVARLLAGREAEGIGVVASYEGEIGFLARLRAPVEVVPPEAAPAWVAAHPAGRLVVRYGRTSPPLGLPPELEQPYRGGLIGVFREPGRAAPGSHACARC